MTGGRIKRAKDYIDNEPFMLTYGDGLSNVDINESTCFCIVWIDTSVSIQIYINCSVSFMF